VHDQEGEQYLKKIYDSTTKFDKSLKELFPSTSDELLRILELMLQINPYLRPTAKQLLKFKIFDKVRVKEVERTSPHKIILKMDVNSEKETYDDSKTPEENNNIMNLFLA
jgi:serine/threonine protein kinase